MAYDFSKHYIDGQWVESTGKDWIDVENPATEERFARVPDGTEDDAENAIRAAAAAQPAWANVPLAHRVELMTAFLEHFKAHRQAIIDYEVQELGSPVTFTASAHCDYQFTRVQSYIDIARDLPLEAKYEASSVYREPVGVVSCITPWNYPLGQIVQKVVPAILMGCTVVLKPSQHTPLTAFLMADAFDKAGFPKGVFNMISGKGSTLGHILATHPLVDMVSFTGSTRVGVQLAQSALQSVKRISLELGGKSPFILLKSDDYAKAMPRLVGSIFYNSGQTCTALSRLIVPEDDLPRIEAIVRETVAHLKVGDPTDPTTDLGPLSSASQFKKVSEYIALGVQEGATLLCGDLPEKNNKGYYVEPTVFSHVTNDMRIAREEIFGPVLCILTYRTVDEAIAIANDTPYGLNAAVFGPKEEAEIVAKQLKAGNVYVNDAPRDVTAPFGGYRESGIGREGGAAGLLEFTQLKAVFDHSSF